MLLILLLLLPLLLVMMAKEIEKRWHKTPHGLYNQGATCYLNSVLQLLFLTPGFHNRLKPNSKTDQEFITLFEKLKKGPCETENITKHFKIDGHKQRDAAEYLELILNKISPSASEMFRGELIYSTKCSKGHSTREETSPFWTLHLPLKDGPHGHFSVKRGLESIFEKKTMSGAYCQDCDESKDVEKKCEMKTAPQVLILLLKRFVYNQGTKSRNKSDCSVEIPATLKIKEKKYALYGVVNHWGSLRGGHYTATIWFSDDRTWYEFSDASVQKAEEQQFDQYRSGSAYLLTYREIHIGHSVTIEVNHDPHTTPGNYLNRQWKIALIVFFIVLIVFVLVLGLVLGLAL